MPSTKALVVFRSDLRVADNPALFQALKGGHSVIALFVLDEESGRAYGGASRWWLHHSLTALAKRLCELNVPLILRKGPLAQTVQSIATEAGVSALFWNRSYDDVSVAFGRALKAWGAENGMETESHLANLLHEPHATLTKSGGHFKVFTPFWRNQLSLDAPREPLPSPESQAPVADVPASDALADWDLLPTRPNWAKQFPDHWTPGEDGARVRLNRFLETGITLYEEARDMPGVEATSGLSPHLRFGEISPYQIWHRTKRVTEQVGRDNSDKFLAEIGWREFSHHLLYHHPALATDNFQTKFNAFPWRDDAETSRLLSAWQKGETGYPIVDAGMRQLWQTGWMHNRVRMIVGSFLVKHLLIDWRAGEDWFWDTLVDACPASNSASWQWVAGSGADAAPYFRIFNPILQGEKFDPEGAYVRHFVPELSKLPNKILHKPWSAKPSELDYFGVELGKTYPNPIVDHGAARDRALNAFKSLKDNKAA
ncbi:MAG: deoxyribodipyrimidine photo-lyase [Pseudomonadota bacterium]